uniref:ubiquitinyl hydrolase 1 n=1 Tax=Lynceus sp. MCZ IZ 141354 TaxID=1930659 RepID=A0A9N6ZEP1_9CRUS|nr:EOG090X0AE1 [Lynceus sp. MCZ IZ 141354]
MASTDTQEPVQDEMILDQQRQIEKEIADSISLIGQLEPVKVLLEEYKDDQIYQAKVAKLTESYPNMRRTRPDGNCFYRAFAFAYFEKLLGDKTDWERFYNLAKESKEELLQMGFPKFTLEDFHDTFVDVIGRLHAGTAMASKELLEIFNESHISDYIVVYLRILTSGQLQKDSSFYENFIEGGATIKEFCQQEVEPMYKESDHIHAIALSTALKVGVRVLYMDRGTHPQVPAHDFPDGVQPVVHLLYRPGHYDILYAS